MLRSLLVLAATAFGLAHSQKQDSFPHDYPGKPSGDFSPAWQSYFEVTESLPNVTRSELGRSFAGNIPVDRPGHPNDTLFFWAWEKQNGSLSSPANDSSNEPWGIWLNGGPGSSSMLGLLFENGPIHVRNDYSVFANNFSWNHVADYIWIDQPVGVGFATADVNGYAGDEDQVGQDFMSFLENLVKVFPSLRTRPLHLTGESYAGTYIPYITKAYFGLKNPPVKLASIAIGDGTVGSHFVFGYVPVLNVIETYPQLIGYDVQVYEYFKEQQHLCGYDLNLTYPQNGHFPTLSPDTNATAFPGLDATSRTPRLMTKTKLMAEAQARYGVQNSGVHAKRHEQREQWKRYLSGRANGTIDPYYACFTYDELIDYALNFTFPWSLHNHDYNQGIDVYNIPDALYPEAPMDASVFLNNASTRAAIHAPTSKDWVSSINYFFNGTDGQDPSVEPMAFLTDLATNATKSNVSVVLYSGNDDSLVPHRGTEVVIQNTTFGGIQGFTRKPSTPWFDDSGEFAGIVHQERNWTYVLFQGAGHLVPQQQPARALTFVREFVFGHNETGLVTNSSGTVTVQGGENATLAEDVMPGQSDIYVGSAATQSTYRFPSATIDAWENFIVTATATASASGASGGAHGGQANGAVHRGISWVLVFLSALLMIS